MSCLPNANPIRDPTSGSISSTTLTISGDKCSSRLFTIVWPSNPSARAAVSVLAHQAAARTTRPTWSKTLIQHQQQPLSVEEPTEQRSAVLAQHSGPFHASRRSKRHDCGCERHGKRVQEQRHPLPHHTPHGQVHNDSHGAEKCHSIAFNGHRRVAGLSIQHHHCSAEEACQTQAAPAQCVRRRHGAVWETATHQ